ncbi:hypothetical protein [Mycobacterium branderi]|uniref:Oxidoreductase n=1 Tax=Mycobacterium branderi TaxID=43348 RepID=A0A7I7W9X3_9MYCO|nr:hypothetical protein [Mycobacterium branderi]MCV7234458.1 hypothetical protein [Mycobacterium branderi]ORA34114.1 hypothetical protein BST20_21110 [Mycobacterium branderi]BBZ13303.1 hypothetical protein MBRA_34980 [Mycobacterium branderi]
MPEVFGDDRIDDVTPGDMIAVERGSGEQLYKVVFKDSGDDGCVVTLEDDDGETFQLQLAAGTLVRRHPESKWESPQSPTPHTKD